MEVQGDRQNNENPFVQHKCQVCIAIRSRNLANEQDHAEKDPDFCKSVLAEHIRSICIIFEFTNKTFYIYILGIQWMDKVSNNIKDLWERTSQVQIEMDRNS